MNMKLKNVLYSMIAAAALASAGSASAASVASDGGILSTLLSQPVDASVTAASKEVWRGADRGDNLITASVGTAFDLPWGVALDAGLTLKDNDASDRETVLSVKGTKVVSDYGLSVELNYYSEGTDVVGDVTSEIGFGVSRNVGSVNVSLTQYFALDGESDKYGEVGVGWSGEVAGREIDVKGALGYVIDETELTHAQVTVGTDFELPHDFVATPFVTGVLSLASDAGGIYDNTDTEVLFGVKVSRSF